MTRRSAHDLPEPGAYSEDWWRDYLTRGSPFERRARSVMKLLPSSPRCHLCAAPFAGPSAPVMRLVGRSRSLSSPNMCNACLTFMIEHRGGAEIDGTMLFADVRGSTTLAESMSAHEFRDRMDRFYTVASQTVFDHDGTVDKFVGDEVVAMFVPLLTGERHSVLAIEAAQALLRATGHEDEAGPWLPVGAGVNTGRAWFGAVGEGEHTELTALGDMVNVTARLAAAAGAGEVLVTTASAEAAGLDPTLPRRDLALKGKHDATQVVTLRVGPRATA